MIFNALVASAATWRLSHMFLYESGPFRIFRHIRERFGVVYDPHDDNFVTSYKYEITTCIWCLSIWVGAATTALLRWSPWGVWLLLPYAFSAVTVALHKLIGKG